MPAPIEIRLDGSLLDGATANLSVAEDAAPGAILGHLTATDADAGDTAQFTLLDDANGTVFLDGSILRLAAGSVLDAGNGPLLITVMVTDGEGNTLTREAVIDLTDVATHSVIRGSADAEVLDARDPGNNRDYIMGLAGDDTLLAAEQDVIVYSGDRDDYVISITPGDLIDDGYGTTTPQDNTITVADTRSGAPDGTDTIITPTTVLFRFADGDYSFEEIEGTMLGIDSPATGLLLDGLSGDIGAVIEENLPAGTVIGQLSLRSRPDGEVPTITALTIGGFRANQIPFDTLTGNAAPFEIDAQGVIRTTMPLDFENYYELFLDLTFTDGTGTEHREVLSIDVLDRDDAPELISAPGLNAFERVTNPGTVLPETDLGSFFLFDQDGSTTTAVLTLAGADADLFEIRDDHLFLRAGSSFDPAADVLLDLQVIVTDTALPGFSITHDLDIRIDAPDPVDAIARPSQLPAEIHVWLAPEGIVVHEGTPLSNGLQDFTSIAFTEAQRAGLEAAFAEFSRVANVTFVFVTDPDEADMALFANGTVRDSEDDTAVAYSFASLDLSIDGSNTLFQDYAVFGMDDMNGGNFTPGSAGFTTYLQVLGNLTALEVPHEDRRGSDVMLGVTLPEDTGLFDLNQRPYTIMSSNGFPTGPLPGAANQDAGRAGSLSPLDIAALQRAYGATTDVNPGDNDYALFDVQGEPGSGFHAIWDTGGIDAISYTGDGNAHISLVAATLDYSATGGGIVSYVEGVTGGFTIANGVVIENARGGSGDDRIEGNAGNNMLVGNAGNDTLEGGSGDDTLDGGTGDDTAIFAGSANGFDFGIDATGLFIRDSDTTDGDEGTDRLVEVELLQFSDGTTATAGRNGLGFEWTLHDLSGARTSRVLLDDADAQSWQVRTETFDASGHRVSIETLFDNGDRQVVTLDPATQDYVALSYEDLSQSNARLASYTDSYIGGVLTERLTIEDDGDTVRSQFAADGSRSHVTFTDVSGTYAYTSVADSFAVGLRTTRHIVLDNADEVYFEFTDGVITLTRLTDGDDDHVWQTYENRFDASGQIVGRVIVDDDGDTQTVSFIDGRPSEVRFADLGTDDEIWDELIFSYDATGALTGQTLVYDDSGDLLDTSFVAGRRTQVTYTDVDGSSAWETRTDYYAADGVTVTQRVFAFADGSETVIDF